MPRLVAGRAHGAPTSTVSVRFRSQVVVAVVPNCRNMRITSSEPQSVNALCGLHYRTFLLVRGQYAASEGEGRLMDERNAQADWPVDLPALTAVVALSGEMICSAVEGRLTDGRRVVVKRCPYPADLEAGGLRKLAVAGAPVPAVLGVGWRTLLRARLRLTDRLRSRYDCRCACRAGTDQFAVGILPGQLACMCAAGWIGKCAASVGSQP